MRGTCNLQLLLVEYQQGTARLLNDHRYRLCIYATNQTRMGLGQVPRLEEENISLLASPFDQVSYSVLTCGSS